MIKLDFLIFAGLVFAFLDHTLYSKLQGMRPQLLRAAYVTLPIMAMPISYVSLREFSANMLEKFTNKKRDSNWTYSIAALGPTGIVMGVASKSATDKSFLTISRITSKHILEMIFWPQLTLQIALTGKWRKSTQFGFF